jgi:hypothetical protein
VYELPRLTAKGAPDMPQAQEDIAFIKAHLGE